MSRDKIPYLAEMIDSYLTLHNDYLRTDSIQNAEDLLFQTDTIEKEMKSKGCKIIYSFEKWQVYFCSLPELQKYGQFVPDLLTEAKDVMKGLEASNAQIVIDCLRLLEYAALKKTGYREIERDFYSKTDIMEIADGTTVIKNVTFNELNLNPIIKDFKV